MKLTNELKTMIELKTHSEILACAGRKKTSFATTQGSIVSTKYGKMFFVQTESRALLYEPFTGLCSFKYKLHALLARDMAARLIIRAFEDFVKEKGGQPFLDESIAKAKVERGILNPDWQ